MLLSAHAHARAHTYRRSYTCTRAPAKCPPPQWRGGGALLPSPATAHPWSARTCPTRTRAEVECPSYGRALSIIEAGCTARSIGATHLNERSSRAHTIVRVQLEGWTDTGAGGRELGSTALLHFVDLAGSERLARTGSSGIRWECKFMCVHTCGCLHACVCVCKRVCVCGWVRLCACDAQGEGARM